jgi:RHS repeat-associated protein
VDLARRQEEGRGQFKWRAGGVGPRALLAGKEVGVCFLAPTFRVMKDRIELACTALASQVGTGRCKSLRLQEQQKAFLRVVSGAGQGFLTAPVFRVILIPRCRPASKKRHRNHARSLEVAMSLCSLHRWTTLLFAGVLLAPAFGQGTPQSPGRTLQQPRPQPRVTGPGQEPRHDRRDAAATAVYQAHASAGSTVLSSGEKRLGRVDLSIPGRGQVHFALRRQYRSRLHYDGPLGFGWDFSYNEGLFLSANGDVVRNDGSGHVDLWVRKPDGSYTAPAGFFGTLLREPGGGYRLRERHGFTCSYDRSGRLLQQRDRSGNTLDFSYDARGNLAQAVDMFGRQVDFVFAAHAGRDRLAVLRDFFGREVHYDYDAAGNLISVRSPVVTGTSTGNDFPQGRTECYGYSLATSGPLQHNLISITRPEEVATLGPPACVITYGSAGLDFDRVVEETIGGTNASAIAAGGTVFYGYHELNAGQPLGDPTLPRLQVDVTERNGNLFESQLNELHQQILHRRLTRGFRAGEPADYVTTSVHDSDGQLLTRTRPEGNLVHFAYDVGGARASQANVLEIRLQADVARGGGNDRITTLSYEPVYNQLKSITDPRENDPSFVPPIGSPAAGRYTRTFFYDYQEGTDPIPDAVQYGIDLSGISRGLGDLNDDVRTDQVAGHALRIEGPHVELVAGSNEALRLGSTLQEILTELQFNDRGQPLAVIDPEGNLTTYDYYPENDPDGDGSVVASGPSPARGYLHFTTVDAATTYRRTTSEPPAALANEYFYDALGNLTGHIDPRGIEHLREVTALNEPVVFRRGTDVSAAAASGQLITGESALAYLSRCTYDHNGRIVEVSVEDRADVSVTPGVAGFVDQCYLYDILDNLIETSVEIDLGQSLVTQYRFDGHDLQTEITLPRGNQHTCSYDERHLPFQQTYGAGSPEAGTYQQDYDANANLVGVVDAEDNDGDTFAEVYLSTYDGFDRRVSATNPIGTVVTFTHDPVSNVVRKEIHGHPPAMPGAPNVLLQDVSIFYDELNRGCQRDQQLFLASGYSTVRPVTLLDGNADGCVTTLQEFNALGRPTFSVEDDGQVTQISYDGASRRVKTTDALGNEQRFTYDQNSNVIQVQSQEVSPEGLVPDEIYTTDSVFDQFNRLVRLTDNAGQTQRFHYDSRDNLTCHSDGEGPLLASDPWGIYPGPINDEGNTVCRTYDGADRLTSQSRDLRVGGLGGNPLDTSNLFNPDGRITMCFGWDANSNLESIQDDNGNVTLSGFDDRDRRTTQTNADGAMALCVYDKDCNKVQISDFNGSLSSRSHDAANRCVQVDVVHGLEVIGTQLELHEFDGLGRRVSAFDDHGGAVEYVTDSLGNRVEERQGLLLQPISRVYSGDHKLLSTTYPDGNTVTQTFDALDRVKTLSNGGSGVITNSFYIGSCKRLLARVFANGTLETYLDDLGNPIGYDDVPRVVRLRHLDGTGTAFLDREYGYNRANLCTFEKRWDDHEQKDSSVYDSAYRLVQHRMDEEGVGGLSHRDFRVHDYLLDGAGNRRQWDITTASSGSGTGVYTVNSVNEYTDVNGAANFYDPNGNTLDDSVVELRYDYRNRLLTVTNKATGLLIMVNRYLADGRRVRKTGYDSSTGAVVFDNEFFYDGQRLVELRDVSGNTLVAHYLHGTQRLDDVVQSVFPGQVLPNDIHFRHRNAHNDQSADTSSSGSLSTKILHDDYACLRTFVDVDPALQFVSSFLWQGRLVDSGLVNFRNRYYGPCFGRFLQRDPVFDPINAGNQYSFCGNSPISRSAPLGLESSAGAIRCLDASIRRTVEDIYEIFSDWRMFRGAAPPDPAETARRKNRKIEVPWDFFYDRRTADRIQRQIVQRRARARKPPKVVPNPIRELVTDLRSQVRRTYDSAFLMGWAIQAHGNRYDGEQCDLARIQTSRVMSGLDLLSDEQVDAQLLEWSLSLETRLGDYAVNELGVFFGLAFGIQDSFPYDPLYDDDDEFMISSPANPAPFHDSHVSRILDDLPDTLVIN